MTVAPTTVPIGFKNTLLYAYIHRYDSLEMNKQERLVLVTAIVTYPIKNKGRLQ